MYGVQTEEDEVITTCDDFNRFHGEDRVMLFVITDDQELIIVGCRTIYDVAWYAAKENMLGKYANYPDEWILLKAHILDPKDLPYEIDRGNCVLVIFQDSVLFHGGTVQEAVDHIEGLFKMGWPEDIDDFAIVGGLELRDKVKRRLKDFLDTFSDVTGGTKVVENLSSGEQS